MKKMMMYLEELLEEYYAEFEHRCKWAGPGDPPIGAALQMNTKTIHKKCFAVYAEIRAKHFLVIFEFLNFIF